MSIQEFVEQVVTDYVGLPLQTKSPHLLLYFTQEDFKKFNSNISYLIQAGMDADRIDCYQFCGINLYVQSVHAEVSSIESTYPPASWVYNPDEISWKEYLATSK